MSTHELAAEYPLAGSDDGLPIVIAFDYVPGRPARRWLNNGDPGDPGYPAEVDFRDVSIPGGDGLPDVIRQAVRTWAEGYLTDDEGYERALDAVADAEEYGRELADELRREG